LRVYLFKSSKELVFVVDISSLQGCSYKPREIVTNITRHSGGEDGNVVDVLKVLKLVYWGENNSSETRCLQKYVECEMAREVPGCKVYFENRTATKKKIQHEWWLLVIRSTLFHFCV